MEPSSQARQKYSRNKAYVEGKESNEYDREVGGFAIFQERSNKSNHGIAKSASDGIER